jgi:hypothetical protein
VTPSDLARELGVTSGSITRLVDELEGRGLTERRRSGHDRRVIHLITPRSGGGDRRLAGPSGGCLEPDPLAIDERERRDLTTSLEKLVTAAETVHTEMEITE